MRYPTDVDRPLYAIPPGQQRSGSTYVQVTLVEDGSHGRLTVLSPDKCPHDGIAVCGRCLASWTDYSFHPYRTAGGRRLAADAGIDPRFDHRPVFDHGPKNQG